MTQLGYWTGVHEIGGNETYVGVANGEVLENNSPLWGPGEPNLDRTVSQCVLLASNSGYQEYDGKLFNHICTAMYGYVCEAV